MLTKRSSEKQERIIFRTHTLQNALRYYHSASKKTGSRQSRKRLARTTRLTPMAI